LVHPWNRLELGIHASLHFCDHSPGVALYRGAAVGVSLRDAAQQGCCARAYMDVFTALPQRDPDGRTV